MRCGSFMRRVAGSPHPGTPDALPEWLWPSAQRPISHSLGRLTTPSPTSLCVAVDPALARPPTVACLSDGGELFPGPWCGVWAGPGPRIPSSPRRLYLARTDGCRWPRQPLPPAASVERVRGVSHRPPPCSVGRSGPGPLGHRPRAPFPS